MPTNNKLEVTYRDTDSLIPYARNAKVHDDANVALIAGSIREFGFNNPVLLDGENGIIAGHGRVLAARKLGLRQVPCIELRGLTDAEKKAYILADNKIAERSEWDVEALGIEVGDLQGMGIDLGAIGFEDSEIDSLLGKKVPEEGPEGEGDGEPPANPKSQEGDIWTLGRHRLMCGDSTDAVAVKALMAGDTASLLLTDPPYNVGIEGGTKDHLTIENDNMDDGAFRKFLVDALTAADGVMGPGAAFYIWHADNEGGYNFRCACREVGWQVRQCLIWNKSSMTLGRQDYQWKHEPCLYGWKGGAGHYWGSDRKQVTVIDFDKPQRNGEHPTMKPVGLFAYQIRNSCKRGGTVLDLFGGSGTTLVACEQEGRIARLMELDPRYCDVIIGRWQALTGGEAVRADGVGFGSL